MYKDILNKLTNRENMTEKDVFEIISAINNDELTDGQISGFLVALVMKGTSLEETAYIAKAMRKNCIPLKPHITAEMMDTCGSFSSKGRCTGTFGSNRIHGV